MSLNTLEYTGAIEYARIHLGAHQELIVVTRTVDGRSTRPGTVPR